MNRNLIAYPASATFRAAERVDLENTLNEFGQGNATLRNEYLAVVLVVLHQVLGEDPIHLPWLPIRPMKRSSKRARYSRKCSAVSPSDSTVISRKGSDDAGVRLVRPDARD